MKKWPILVLLVSFLIISTLAGCGGSNNSSPSNNNYYALVTVGGKVASYQINPSTGALTPVGTPQDAGGGSYAIAINPAKTFIYVSDYTTGKIYSYKINQTSGALTSVGSSDPITFNLGSIAMDAEGKFIYSSDDGGATAANGHINMVTTDPTTGSVSSGSTATIPGSNTSFVIVRGQYLYACNSYSGDHTIKIYSINPSNGVLTLITSGATVDIGPNTEPSAITIDPQGHFLFVSDISSGGQIFSYQLDVSSGKLNHQQVRNNGYQPLKMTVDPTGKFLYAANYFDDKVTGYLINSSDGTLTPVSGSPAGSGSHPRYPAFDPNGKFLYVANSQGHSISIYPIGDDGAIGTPSVMDLGAGNQPNCIVTFKFQ